MALPVSQFFNPWTKQQSGGTGTELGRSDMWLADFSLATKTMLNIVQQATAQVDPSMSVQLNNALSSSVTSAVYLCQSVQLPSRVMGKGQQIRRDNGAFVPPGYQENVNTVQCTFLHELASGYVGSHIWALLTVWRAVARAGQGPDFPGSEDIYFPLQANFPGVTGLIPPYRNNFYLAIAGPVTGDGASQLGGTGGTSAINNGAKTPITLNGNSLQKTAGYVVRNAWPLEFGLEPVSYEGSKFLMIHAVFQCDDVLNDTAF